jgi:putative membrane protein
MKSQFLIGYLLASVLAVWSIISSNYEFVIYAVAVAVLVALLHLTYRVFRYQEALLWAFVVWIVLHILGGLWKVGDEVLYSAMLISLVGEPYSILKYDQVVHTYCYFVVALIMWRVTIHLVKPDASRGALILVTVLAATGIGGINEIVEFLATVMVPETNVGGYENTAIDIVTNLLGALLAIPFFKPGANTISNQ